MNKIDQFFKYKGISPDDIPKIPLYMDQLLSLFDEFFDDFRRENDEKIITKTMVNNYVKAKVIDPPVKKKYAKEQIMMLTLVYQLKNILPINDIKAFFDLYDSNDYTDAERKAKIEEYFKIFNHVELEHLENLKERHDNFKATLTVENDKKALIARLLVEADLNKRLAQLLMDAEHQQDV